MAAERTTGATIPEELLRQSGRVTEQLQCLFKILDTTTDHLEDMSVIMGDYSPELTAEIKKLKDSIVAYRAKSNDIYTDVSDELRNYATNLINNLTELTTSVQNISAAIESL